VFFDPQPKTRREDLFGREEELSEFSRALPYASMIVVTGQRRSGKTSFMNVALAESRLPFIIMDLRGLPYNPSRAEMVRRFESSFNALGKKWMRTLAELLAKIKGVTISGTVLNFSWAKEGVDLAELFDRTDSWATDRDEKFIIAFDEIQSVRGYKDLVRLFAHIADNDRSIRLVFAGSEVGLLFDFLGFQNPQSPLYGRHFTEILMRNFDNETAKAYLRTGFQQIQMNAQDELIEMAVQYLDGVVGWLTYLGAKSRDQGTCTKELIERVTREGGRLAREEALHMVQRSGRYGTILNFLAKVGEANWRHVKSRLEASEQRNLLNASVADLLSTLVKTGFVRKSDETYSLADPLLRLGIVDEPLLEL